MSLSRDVGKVCSEAFEIGLYSERKFTQIELMEKISWIRGKYKTIFWEAYKCGVWTRKEKAAQPALHLTQAGGGNEADENQPPAQVS